MARPGFILLCLPPIVFMTENEDVPDPAVKTRLETCSPTGGGFLLVCVWIFRNAVVAVGSLPGHLS